jgi:hypothetical protein
VADHPAAGFYKNQLLVDNQLFMRYLALKLLKPAACCYLLNVTAAG